ncbi:MAG TPA: CpsB/CapC family capsule biosynthesis tyrosine phosphatase, partial [Polyangiaceae bacterium]|nr:CpsB/CapC family capsule biosynthesis tyrosine phosphatase [Polyangiaceae bacterium]
MRGFVDLHCHWIAAIDDGAKTTSESLEMLRGLRQVGFDHVVATPHMRPGMFDNDRARIESAFEAMKPVLSTGGTLPSVHLASEHFFDDVVFGRLVRGEAVPYPRLANATGATAATTEPAPTARQRRRPVLIEF